MPENKTEERPPQLDNVRDNATQEDFKMKNKVWEMLEYAGPQLEEFPRAKRGLAQKIDGTMLDILELVIMLESIIKRQRLENWTQKLMCCGI